MGLGIYSYGDMIESCMYCKIMLNISTMYCKVLWEMFNFAMQNNNHMLYEH